MNKLCRTAVALAAAAFAWMGALAAEAADPPPAPGVYLTYNFYHSDVVVPRAELAKAPGALGRAAASIDAPWVLVGWGDEKFGRHSNIMILRMFSGAIALLRPGEHSVVRLLGLPTPTTPVEDYGAVRRIELSPDDVARLVQRVDASLKVGPDGGPVLAHVAAVSGETFFESLESYSWLHQCNHWVGQLLRAGGAHTTPFFDAAPFLILVDLGIHGRAGRLMPRGTGTPLPLADAPAAPLRVVQATAAAPSAQ